VLTEKKTVTMLKTILSSLPCERMKCLVDSFVSSRCVKAVVAHQFSDVSIKWPAAWSITQCQGEAVTSQSPSHNLTVLSRHRQQDTSGRRLPALLDMYISAVDIGD